MKKTNKKGFTLAELLIVIAIIAILIAIAIPTFSGALENAKRQTDHANMRNAYAMAQVANLNGGVILDKDGKETFTGKTKLVFNKSGELDDTLSADEAYKIQAKHSAIDYTDCKSCVACSDVSNPATATYIILDKTSGSWVVTVGTSLS